MAAKNAKWFFALNYPESEATPPFQRIRYGDDVSVYLVDRHGSVIDRREFDVRRILDRTPDELSVTGLFFEPTAERVVSAEICVHGVVHCRDIALPGYFTAGDDLPGEGQPPLGRPLRVVAKVLTLHIADRHQADRRLSSLFFPSRGRRMPGRDRTRTQRPFFKRADRDLPDAQCCRLPPRFCPVCRLRPGITPPGGINILSVGPPPPLARAQPWTATPRMRDDKRAIVADES